MNSNNEADWPVDGELGLVLVPEDECGPVPGVGVAGGAVTGDGHALPHHAHNLVLHNWNIFCIYLMNQEMNIVTKI